jgi:hypothetical protein
MATYAPVAPALTAVAPTYNAATATDVIAPTLAGARYLIHIKNAAGSGTFTMVVDDPTSGVGVAGATTPQNPDVTISVGFGTERAFLIDATRFRDATGNINLVNATTTSVTYAIWGPF